MVEESVIEFLRRQREMYLGRGPSMTALLGYVLDDVTHAFPSVRVDLVVQGSMGAAFADEDWLGCAGFSISKLFTRLVSETRGGNPNGLRAEVLLAAFSVAVFTAGAGSPPHSLGDHLRLPGELKDRALGCARGLIWLLDA